MDRRLLRYYDRELRHLQTVGKEFAREFPKVAGRLALEDFPCVDPYVERLLEGYAFLASRVQLKLDAEFPRFTQNLLETVYPHALAPTPSMCVVQFQHDPAEAGLAEGFPIPRGTALKSTPLKDLTACEYRTAHDVSLWPVQIAEARYFTRDVGTLELGRPWGLAADAAPPANPMTTGVRAGLRLRLRTTANLPFNKTKLKSLVLYLKGGDATPMRVFESMFAHAKGVICRPVPVGTRSGPWQTAQPTDTIKRLGLSAKEALLPYDPRSFQGYRLLHEYFAFMPRFMFVEIAGLEQAVAKCDGPQLDIIIPFSQENPDLEGAVDADNFALHCSPAVNLFPKRCDRILISDRASEFQVTVDRMRPMDFEVHTVQRVSGFGAGGSSERVFKPFFAATSAEADIEEGVAYFATHRMPRALSDREKQRGMRSGYAGGEVYVSLVDAQAAPYSSDLKQLLVEVLCTNRDLPLAMPLGRGKTDFSMDVAAPVQAIRCLTGPTPPRASHAEGDTSWRLISHLSLNYLSLADERVQGDTSSGLIEDRGAIGLREILKLYSDIGDPSTRKQIDGVRTIKTQPITRRVPTPGVVAFARGLEVAISMEEGQYEGTGVFILGSVLEQFFARYVSLNSFTETVIHSLERGEIMRWPARVGQRPIL
jgi:type VI secretion system protein ImpG